MNSFIQAFESWSNIESIITTIAGALGTILIAIGTVIQRCKGKSGKELLSQVNKDTISTLKDTIKTEGDIIKKAVEELSDIAKKK